MRVTSIGISACNGKPVENRGCAQGEGVGMVKHMVDIVVIQCAVFIDIPGKDGFIGVRIPLIE